MKEVKPEASLQRERGYDVLRRTDKKGYYYICTGCDHVFKTFHSYRKHSLNPTSCDIENNLQTLKKDGWVLVHKSLLRHLDANKISYKEEITSEVRSNTSSKKYRSGIFVQGDIGWLLRTFKGDCLHFLLTLVKTEETFLPAISSIRKLNGDSEAKYVCVERYDKLLIPDTPVHRALVNLAEVHTRFLTHCQDLGWVGDSRVLHEPPAALGTMPKNHGGTTSIDNRQLIIVLDAVHDLVAAHYRKYVR